MRPRPHAEMRDDRGAGKLQGKVALITGGDSGIGHAVAIGFAKEGADGAILYLDEHDHAEATNGLVEALPDAGRRHQRRGVLSRRGRAHGRNFRRRAAPGGPARGHRRRPARAYFRTNIVAMFHVTKAVLTYLTEGTAIINATSVTAYRGSSHLIDYADQRRDRGVHALD